MTIAPGIHALRRAYDDATRSDGPEDPDSDHPQTEARQARPEALQPTDEDSDAPTSPSTDGRVIGVKDGQSLAWHLARAQGLGLVGPGALGAIRALLVALLGEPRQPTTAPTEILIPASDARMLIGERAGHLTRLRIVDDIDAALDAMETELLTRARTHTDPDTAPDADDPHHGDLVLVATSAPHADRRLDAIREPLVRPEALAEGIVIGGSRKGRRAGIDVTARRRGQSVYGVAKYTESTAFLAHPPGEGLRPTGFRHTSGHAKGRNPGDVWSMSPRPLRAAHFAAFPIDLPLRCIGAGCPPRGTVLDPFSGAATTALAARQLERRYIGIDLRRDFHDIGLDRLGLPRPRGEETA
nr:site-specific DNA-methyltransferase [Streptomyces cupreus]